MKNRPSDNLTAVASRAPLNYGWCSVHSFFFTEKRRVYVYSSEKRGHGIYKLMQGWPQTLNSAKPFKRIPGIAFIRVYVVFGYIYERTSPSSRPAAKRSSECFLFQISFYEGNFLSGLVSFIFSLFFISCQTELSHFILCRLFLI